MDYVIHIAYTNSFEFRTKVNNLPFICNIHSLVKVLNSEYKNSDFKCYINKLRWKNKYISIKNETQTNYGYIIEKNKFNSSHIFENANFL